MKARKLLLTFAGFSMGLPLFAQQGVASTAPNVKPASINSVELMMIAISIVLAFVIWGMGQVLYTLGSQLMEKRRTSGNLPSLLLLIGLISFSSMARGQEVIAAAAAPSTSYGTLNSGSFWALAVVIGIEVIVITYLMFNIRALQNELLPPAMTQKSKWSDWWKAVDRRFFTRAVSVEKEADVLLDHDYDGIRELDNALPPWWKYGFYVSIVAGVIYMFNFHVFGTGKNPTEEYAAEMERAKIEIAEYNAKSKDKIDENNIAMPAAAGIAKGKELYGANCWACHGKLGEGGAGPNLTDDYWIHKGSLNDIYQSIKHGYPEKGMQAWEKQFSPKEISYLTGYVKTLRGTNPPNPKLPQGDLYNEATSPSDSSVAKPEAAAVKI